MSVDVEIYMNNIIKFFRENPNDLLNLVPKAKEEEFYSKLREVAFQNYEKGEEVSLTRTQMIEICAQIHGKTKKIVEEKKEFTKYLSIDEILKHPKYQELSLDHLIVFTEFGNYSLN
jgi:hypothetical protein